MFRTKKVGTLPIVHSQIMNLQVNWKSCNQLLSSIKISEEDHREMKKKVDFVKGS